MTTKTTRTETPRDRVLTELRVALARMPWDHPGREQAVEAAFSKIRRRDRQVRVGVEILQKTPLPSLIRRRLATRTPLSTRAAQYLDTMNARARSRLVRQAWREANPRWKLP